MPLPCMSVAVSRGYTSISHVETNYYYFKFVFFLCPFSKKKKKTKVSVMLIEKNRTFHIFSCRICFLLLASCEERRMCCTSDMVTPTRIRSESVRCDHIYNRIAFERDLSFTDAYRFEEARLSSISSCRQPRRNPRGGSARSRTLFPRLSSR